MLALALHRNNVSEFLPVYDEEFLDAAIDLFAGFRAGHIGRYCYASAKYPGDPVRGDQYWADFVRNHTGYYLYRDEVQIFADYIDIIAAMCGGTRYFVELGPGSREAIEKKTLKLLRTIRPETYTAGDISSATVTRTIAQLCEAGLNMPTNSFIGNFFSDLPILRKDSLLFLVGSSISNIVIDVQHETVADALTRILCHFAQSLKNGGLFVFTFDSNQNEKEIHTAYEHPLLAAHEMTIIHRIQRDLPTHGFEPSHFRHKARWIPEHHLWALGIETMRATNFYLGDHHFSFPADRFFWTGSCFKYPEAMVEKCSKAAGFDIVSVFSLPNSSLRLAVLRISSPPP